MPSRISTTFAEKPHWGCPRVPFMYSTTGFSVTVCWMRLRTVGSMRAEPWPCLAILPAYIIESGLTDEAVNIEGAVSMLQTFADATRVRLLGLLADGELTVAELTTITELSQSRVSTHLGRLKESGLLRDRRVGTTTYYAL